MTMPRAEHEVAGRAPRALAVLPARLGSTRLARKMLLAETGTPLVVHTARAVLRCDALARVIVATDSDEILGVARSHGLEAVLTSPEHASGTDRVHEAASALPERYDVVLNVQADEPEVDAADLALLVSTFADAAIEAATLRHPIRARAEFEDPSVVKVVCDARGDALYFSRAAIPSRSHARPSLAARGELPLAWRHLGVYAWRPAALARFCALAPTELEESESLEQLRWLENGGRMRVRTARTLSRGIDTRKDYDEFVARRGGA
jgi:3-deoxy-manno-octulosonate cytidylyltransferase (CMP-KDO synthetase)